MRHRIVLPTAWVSQIFEASAVAKRGGPVRRRLSSIDRNASRVAVIAEAKRRGWIVDQIGCD